MAQGPRGCGTMETGCEVSGVGSQQGHRSGEGTGTGTEAQDPRGTPAADLAWGSRLPAGHAHSPAPGLGAMVRHAQVCSAGHPTGHLRM